MSAGGASRLSANGRYGTVGFSGGQTAPMGQVKQVDETTRRRELVDTEQLSEEFREAIEADHFFVYGKASVEQFDEDDPPQKLTMEALAEALPQLYDDGIISRRHKDVPIGEVVPEHTLEESTEVEVGDETFAFDGGDTLETHIDEDEESFWIVADIGNGSEIAKDTRLRALTGELDGFSVTIYAKEWETTDAGEVVTELDWHAVTIGRDDQIKNKESRFGVAEFKALFGSGSDTNSSDGALAGGISTIRHEAQKTMEDTFNTQLFSKAGQEMGFDPSRLEAASAFAQKADEEDSNEELTEKAEAAAEDHDVSPKAVVELANHLTGEKADMSEDVVQVLDAVEEEMGEEARDALEGAIGSGGGGDAPGDAEEAKEGELKGDDEDEDDEEDKMDDEDDDEDEKSVPDNVVTDEKLEAKLDERLGEVREDLKADMEESVNSLGDDLEEMMKGAISDTVPDIVDETAEKMATGSTDDPAQGSTQDQVDYGETIEASFGGEGGEA